MERRLPVVALVSPASTPHPWFSISNNFFRLTCVLARIVQTCQFFVFVVVLAVAPPPPKRRRCFPDAPLAVTTRSRAAATMDIPVSIVPVFSVAVSIESMSGSDRFYPLSIEDFRVARRALVYLAQVDQLSDVIR